MGEVPPSGLMPAWANMYLDRLYWNEMHLMPAGQVTYILPMTQVPDSDVIKNNRSSSSVH